MTSPTAPALESSILLRVSFVNLQKFTFHSCDDCASIRMFAPAQNIRSLALVDGRVSVAQNSAIAQPTALPSSSQTRHERYTRT